MAMNDILREKRKALGLTQEQVAEALGVSTPAVNKWEKGASYPDITLLPALARLLKTDLNTLLCFCEELSPKEIGLFLNRVGELFHEAGLEAAFALAMEKVREYPASAALLHPLAMVLHGSLMMSELAAEEKQAYDEKITALYERVVRCDDPKYSDEARYLLASRQIAAGQYEEAQALLDALPERPATDKRSLQANLWMKEGKHQQAAELLERKLLATLQEMQASLGGLAKLAVQEGETETALRLAQCGQETVSLFGLWEYGGYVVPLEVATLRRDVPGSMATLQAMLAALLCPWEQANSPVCKHIAQKAGEKNFGMQFLPTVLQELETSDEYDFLREEPEFLQLLRDYRAKCGGQTANP